LSDFSQDFPAITVAPVRNLDGKQQLRLFIDRCSVEMFGTAGEWVMTNLVFPIEEDRPDKASGVVDCLRLLGTPFILLCFLGIMCHVGIDVGTNTTAPKILMERLGLPLEEAGFATGLYFIFRTAGCFLGAFILRVVSPRLFFAISVIAMAIAMAILFVGQSLWLLYVGIALIGFGNSNIFSIVFAQALNALPKEKNAVSGLMIMGLFGGTIFPLAMGYASDLMGQAGAVAVMTVGVVYLLYYTLKIKK
jgi:fucose permease